MFASPDEAFYSVSGKSFRMKRLSFSEWATISRSKEAYTINPNELKGVKMEKGYIKSFGWGMAVGMLVLLIVIFSTGWVVTSNSAKAMANEISENAVVERLAPIAVAQFMKNPNREEKLKELKGLDTWKRADYVKNQGWAIMPGEKESDYGVARECARLLVEPVK